MLEANESNYLREFNSNGFFIVPDVFPLDFILLLREELEIAIEKEAAWHKTKNYQDYGMVMLCALYGGTFIEIFDFEKFLKPMELVMGKGCITYAYTSSSLPPGGTNYSARIHVDCPRLIKDYITNLGVLIAVDEFTPENGATWFLPGSQARIDRPEDNYFFEHARQISMKAGAVCYFNARTWHCSARNGTQSWRHGVSMNICRPYMKQRIDIPRALSSTLDPRLLSDVARQKLGFDSQVPASYEEYYLPKESRKFKQTAE